MTKAQQLHYLGSLINDRGWTTQDTRQAVRDLMAERDELLAACKEVKRWIEEDTLVDLEDLSDDAREILAMVRAVVAKAKGGTP